jgi:hypothetical protein
MTLSDRFDHTQINSGPLAGLSTPEGVRARARRSVVLRATGPEDARLLLDALGLGPTPEEIADRRAAVAVGPTETPSRNDEETTER